MGRLLNRFMSWLQEGYPDGVPPTDQVPLIALLTSDMSRADAVLAAGGEVAE